MKFLEDTNTFHRIDFINTIVKEKNEFIKYPLEHCMMFSATKNDIDTSRCYIGSEDLVDCILTLESSLDEDNPSQSENIQ